jgi:ABC-2 type transport system permease protein
MIGSPVVSIGDGWASASRLRFTRSRPWDTGSCYAITAVIAMAIGILIRHSAGVISLLLIYNLAVEGLISLIPTVGVDIHKWMPFNVAHKFLTGDGASNGPRGANAGPPLSDSPLSPGWALAYFAEFALVLLDVAIVVARKRDA